jgi:hypothetical protein
MLEISQGNILDLLKGQGSRDCRYGLRGTEVLLDSLSVWGLKMA